MANPNNPVLWKNDKFTITTLLNPHFPYSEGLHLIVAPNQSIGSAWEDPVLAGEAFELASRACGIMEKSGMAPWFNIQFNGYWGLLAGASPFFHLHIYGRNKTTNWGKPVVLPEAPHTYRNDPMPQADQDKLIDAFRVELS